MGRLGVESWKSWVVCGRFEERRVLGKVRCDSIPASAEAHLEFKVIN